MDRSDKSKDDEIRELRLDLWRHDCQAAQLEGELAAAQEAVRAASSPAALCADTALRLLRAERYPHVYFGVEQRVREQLGRLYPDIPEGVRLSILARARRSLPGGIR